MQISQLTWANTWIWTQFKVVPKINPFHSNHVYKLSCTYQGFHCHKFTITEWNSRCVRAWESGIHKGRQISRQKQLWDLSQSWISVLMLRLGAGEGQAVFNKQIPQHSGTTVEALSPRECTVYISLSEKFLLERDSPPTACEKKHSLRLNIRGQNERSGQSDS